MNIDHQGPRASQDVSFDMAYVWGRSPTTYLATREIVRLTIFRSRLLDSVDMSDRAAIRNGLLRVGQRQPDSTSPA